MADLQQPNAQNVAQAIRNIAGGYQDLATEAARIQNIPAFNQGGQIIQMLQQLLQGQQQLQNQVGELQNQVGELQSQFRELQNTQQRLPTMLYNASTSDLAPLRYPAGIPISNLPETRRELATFTGPQLQVAAGVLGLPALAGNPLVDQRRGQIAEYLGIPY